jgi:hypothetical protein
VARMTPEKEAAYALLWDLDRDSLDPAVQIEYDLLKLEREGRPGIQAATPRKTEPEPLAPGPFFWLWYWRRTGSPPVDVPAWLVIPGLILFAAFMIWMSLGAYITGHQIDFTTLRSDVSKIHLPAGYEKTSSERHCRAQRCTLTEFWVWRAGGPNTAADACRDLGRAMKTGFRGVEADPPPYRPRGTACEYYTSLENFLYPYDRKRFVNAFVWVNGKAKGSQGGFKVELVAAYNY